MSAFDKAWAILKQGDEPMPQLGERTLLDNSADITFEEAQADEAAGRGKIHRLPDGSYEFVGYYPNGE
jgi:hypothetical protein